MSAPEAAAGGREAAGVRLASCACDIVEIAALRRGARTLGEAARARGWPLPAPGRIAGASGGLILCVRPERWLLLSPPAATGARAQLWQEVSRGCGAAVDLSCALTALYVSGPAVREMLARGCRLDLDPQLFPPGSAAATLIAQVPVTLATLVSGMLLLTPATTARHYREWLAATAKPFGLLPAAGVSVELLSAERLP